VGLLYIHRQNTIRTYWNRPDLLSEVAIVGVPATGVRTALGELIKAATLSPHG